MSTQALQAMVVFSKLDSPYRVTLYLQSDRCNILVSMMLGVTWTRYSMNLRVSLELGAL